MSEDQVCDGAECPHGVPTPVECGVMHTVNPLALVTGATGGIGRVVTRALVRAGYDVLAVARTDTDLRALVIACAHMDALQQGAIFPLPLNVVTAHAWCDVAERIEQCQLAGQLLTLVVVCHGMSPRMIEATNASVETTAVFSVDVGGAQLACECAYPFMRPHGGSIVLVGSLHARMTYPQRVPYATAKAALGGLTRAMAVEWGCQGIRVNTILPWQVEGPRTQRFIDAAAKRGEDLLEAYKRRSPLRRLVLPEDIAETVLWLARTPSVTGQEIVLDCGVSASMWYDGYRPTETFP